LTERIAKPGEIVDHINGDTLDNRKQNLRIATPLQNARNKKRAKNNTSGFKGVEWDPRRSKWRAAIVVQGRRRHLGHFDDAREASKRYEEAAKNIFGQFYRPDGKSPETNASSRP